MRRRRSIKAACLSAAAAALVLCGLSAAAAASATGPAAARPREGAQYDRPDADTIRAEVKNVLADPRLAPQPKTLWQRASGWVWQKLKELLAGAGGRGAWGKTIFWILISWCVLTLLAILAHMAWTIVVLVRGGRRGKAARGAGRRFHAERPTAYEELQDLMRRAAEKGAFREAIRLMMLSLLQLLDRTGAVRVQDGKTNGEYVREYSPRRPGREAFTRFVLAFDEAVYGSARCDGHTYRDMNVRFDQARGNVKG